MGTRNRHAVQKDFDKYSDLSTISVIGSTSLVYRQPHTDTLRSKRAWESRLVGCNPDCPSYRIHSPSMKNMMLSRNVTIIVQPRTIAAMEDGTDHEKFIFPDEEAVDVCNIQDDSA